MTKRITEAERLDAIQKFINKKPTDGFVVKETKDKDGNEKYIVRRIDNRTQRQILEDKIKELQAKLAKININENDTPSVEQPE